MADKKISQLSSGAPAQATDETVIARGGANYKLTVSNIVGYLGSPITVANGGTGQTTANAAFNALAPAQATNNGKYLKTDGSNTSWDALDISTADVTGTLPIANGGTGATTLAGANIAVFNVSNTFTAAQTFRAASAVRSEAASTQDAVVLAGRAGGTNSWAATLTPATLSGNRTVTIPDETFTVGFRNVPQSGSAKTSNYGLVVGDVGKFIEVGASGAITIPDATFAAGDMVSIFNNTSGNITITCTITTAYIAGTDADKATVTLATRGVATILFLSGTVCVISGNVS
jgi:hypothetical protein